MSAKRDLVANLTANTAEFETRFKKAKQTAEDLRGAELRLIAAEERLKTLRAGGQASAGQLASAEARVIAAKRGVTKATDDAGTAQRRFAGVMDDTQRRTGKAFAGIQGAAASMRTGVGLAAAAGGAAMVAMGRQAVNAATGLNEQLAATETIFKDAARSMVEFGESASAIGLSEQAALQAANGFGDLFTKIGFTHEAAAVFSEDLVRMSADFASFKDLDPGEVLLKLKSGLAGESEPLRSLGVFLTEAKVKAEAATLGLGDIHGELTEGEKVTARYSLIIQGMGEAYGDVARTADSYANTQRRAAAEAENLKAALGQQLLPVLTDLSYVMTEGSKGMQGLSDSTGGFLGAIASTSPVSMLADGIRKLKGDSDDATDSTDYLADSQKILANSQEYTAEQVEKATATIKEQAEALDRLLQATIAQFDTELRYQLAVLGVTDAIADYDDALKKNRDGKADNDLTASELTKKEIGLKDALLGAAGAAVKQAEDQAAAAGRVLTESEKFDLFREALLKLKEQFPALAKQIDGYVARLDKVPPQVSTVANLDTSQATSSAAALKALLGDLDGRTVTTTVQTTRTTRELLLPPSLSGSVPKRATGGAVFGPGTGTSDSIPALLSNGEHVWTAREVIAAGGHAAVERMRRAVHGFRNGGRVLARLPEFSTLALAGGGPVDQYAAVASATRGCA